MVGYILEPLLMETYYTAENFLIYVIMILLLIILIPGAALAWTGKRSVPTRLCLIFLMGAVSLYPLSRTCPYDLGTTLLVRFSWGSLAVSLLCVFFRLSLLLVKKGKLQLLTEEDGERWINVQLQGSYLVMDGKGMILGGHLNSIFTDSEKKWDSFYQYRAMLVTNFGAEQIKVLERALISGKAGEGLFIAPSQCCRWHVSPLGESEDRAVLFSLLDITDEYRLIKEKEDQEKILQVQLERIREQKDGMINDERKRQESRIMKESGRKIISRLRELESRINPQLTSDMIGPVRELGEKTMGEVRSVVHALTGEGEIT